LDLANARVVFGLRILLNVSVLRNRPWINQYWEVKRELSTPEKNTYISVKTVDELDECVNCAIQGVTLNTGSDLIRDKHNLTYDITSIISFTD